MLRSLRTRGKEKNTGIPNPGVEVVASKLLPNYLEFMPGYLGAFTLNNSGSDFHPRLPSPSLPIHLRHKHIYSFKQHLFVFQESDTGRPLLSAVPGRCGCKSDTWHWTWTSLTPTFSPEENRGLSKPRNQLSFFLRLLSCRRIDKWQWLQPNL